MNSLNLKAEQKIDKIESFEFAPIKGQPMLRWTGKRPFTSTQFYPAQLKESYGNEVEGWINKLFWGDNLQVMSHLLKTYRGQIDLIYIDPPFDSKADYKKKIELRGTSITNDSTPFEEKQYTDIWSNDEYLQFMYERLILMRELLSDTGTIYLHCDWHKSHHLRMIMDEVFGPNSFLNEVVWAYGTYIGQTKTNFPRKHDTLLVYTKTSQYTFNMLRDDDLDSDANYKRWKKYFNDKNQVCGDNYPADDSKFSGYVKRFKKEHGRDPQFSTDVILEISGKVIDDVWYIQSVNPFADERIGYPTQKPEELLERIMLASTNPGDLVFDCFMGSGTTQNVALKLGRKFIGADINLGAIETTIKRLNKTLEEYDSQSLFDKEEGNRIYSGFEVYNVNNYDVFRNPSEAKDIIIKALELQPLPSNSLYDGEKDGRMVKIMPVNRIATKQDLNELITGFPREEFEKRQASNPNKPIEFITLVCMGHEPHLAADLTIELKNENFNIDVEVLDILRDRVDLEFKRDSVADISVDNNYLRINEFYPMNLLQKLSIQKEEVKDWRELVDSIKVDFNYDGAVFSPSVIDVPEGKKLVSGVYNIPKGAGVIKVKITDLLSESLEQTIKVL